MIDASERGKCDTFSSLTANGHVARRGTVAVWTSQFRFGTRFHIPNYGYGFADDTGGAIGPGRIDLAVNTCKEAYSWGSRRVFVEILKK